MPARVTGSPMKFLTTALAALLLLSSCDCGKERSTPPRGKLLTRVYQLEYLQPVETLRALQSLDLDQSVTVRTRSEANQIVATFTDPEHGNAIAALLEQIDIKSRNPESE